MPASILMLFLFRNAWMGGQESASKKDKKRALGMESNTTLFSMLLS